MTTDVRHAAFVITGEFITEHARILWADERKHAQALRFLQVALPALDVGQAVAVLTGQAKLIGDSTAGVELADDQAETSPYGSPLPSLQESFERLSDSLSAAERDTRDWIEILGGNGVLVPSPTGGRIVSRATVEELRRNGGDWSAVRAYQNATADQYKHAAVDGVPMMPPPTAESPLESFPAITQGTGWLSPDGRFYPCLYADHVRWAQRICEERAIARRPRTGEEEAAWDCPHEHAGERELELLGWIKLTGNYGALEPERPATKAQQERLLDWCLGDGKELTRLPYWLEPGR